MVKLYFQLSGISIVKVYRSFYIVLLFNLVFVNVKTEYIGHKHIHIILYTTLLINIITVTEHMHGSPIFEKHLHVYQHES